MKPSSLASLILLAAAACGTTSSPPPKTPGNTAPPVTGGCEVSGPELFAARTSPTRGNDLLLNGKPMGDTATILYRSGGWMVTGTDQPRTGCLSTDDLARAEALLTDLPLEVRHPAPDEPRCMAEALSSTTYSVRGQAVYTAMMCSGESIDGKSQQAFNDVEKLLADAAAAAAPAR